MPKVYVKNRELVLPGDLLAEGDIEVTGFLVYKHASKYYSTIIGLVNVENDRKVGIIPLEGPYIPKVGDIVIGLIVDLGITNWLVDIRAPYTAILNASDALNKPFNPIQDDLRNYYDVGDYIVAKIQAFDRVHNPTLTTKGKGLGKITSGKVIEIKPSRTPRVIGKKKSMLNVLTGETGCEVVVGANGRIWIQCANEDLEEILILAIKKIEQEAHTTGLTDKIRNFIEEEKKRRGLS